MPKVVLITGGSSGIGEAIAAHLGKNLDYIVYATSRKPVTNQFIGGVTFLQLDVTSSQSCEAAVKNLIEKEGKIDVLINNAGIDFAGPIEDTSREELHQVLETNLYGVLDMCRVVLPYMRQNKSGRIINISSLAGRFGLPFRGVYSASKFALEGLTESLSQEVQQFGIQVSIVEPGDFATNISQNRQTTLATSNSVYNKQFTATYNLINQEVAHSLSATIMAKAIEKILRKKKPKLRYVVSTPFQKFTLTLKALLPDRVFEKLLMNHYKIPAK